MGKVDPLNNKAASGTCPNCGADNSYVDQELTGYMPDKPGPQYNPYSTNQPMYLPRNKAADSFNLKDKKKDELNDFRKDKNFVSEEIKQCPNLEVKRKRNKRRFVELNREDVTKSCEDLAIDG